MPAERYYYPGNLDPSDSIVLDGPEFIHLSKVMRSRVGDLIELVNGKGALAQGQVVRLDKREAHIRIEDCRTEKPSERRLIIAQAIPRLNRLETILEKGTELGMDEIWLFPGALSEKTTFSENQLARMEYILITAMKQCGRLFLPKLVFEKELKKWEKLNLPAYFGDVREDASHFFDEWVRRGKQDKFLFFIGPESGFTIEETEKLESLGAKGVKLHPYVLRTDTASLCALSQYFSFPR